jgi:hypothetical protein
MEIFSVSENTKDFGWAGSATLRLPTSAIFRRTVRILTSFWTLLEYDKDLLRFQLLTASTDLIPGTRSIILKRHVVFDHHRRHT